MTEYRHSKMLSTLEPEVKYETDDIIVTPHGAFHKSKAATEVIPPEIFKLTKPSVVDFNGACKITNRDGKWKAEMPMTQDLWVFFGDKSFKYVIATPNASGKLHIECEFIPSNEEDKW